MNQFALIPDVSSSIHIIVSLPYIRIGTSKVSCKSLAHQSCKPLALTRDLLTPDTLLPLAAFLLHSTSSVPDLSRAHPKYLNSTHVLATSYLRESHTPVPPLHSTSSPCFYLHWLSDLFPYTSTKLPTTALRSSSDLPHKTNSSPYKSPGNPNSLLSFPSSFLPTSLLHPYMHLTGKGTPLSFRTMILNHSLYPPFTLTQA